MRSKKGGYTQLLEICATFPCMFKKENVDEASVQVVRCNDVTKKGNKPRLGFTWYYGT